MSANKRKLYTYYDKTQNSSNVLNESYAHINLLKYQSYSQISYVIHSRRIVWACYKCFRMLFRLIGVEYYLQPLRGTAVNYYLCHNFR